jgi:hypothetical protein
MRARGTAKRRGRRRRNLPNLRLKWCKVRVKVRVRVRVRARVRVRVRVRVIVRES